MSFAIDANILIYASNEGSPEAQGRHEIMVFACCGGTFVHACQTEGRNPC